MFAAIFLQSDRHIVLYLKHFKTFFRLVLNSLLNPNLPVGEGVFDPEADVEDQVRESLIQRAR
jgi:hypothetical protein